MAKIAHRRVLPAAAGIVAALWLAHGTSATETPAAGLVVPPASATYQLYVDGDANAGAPPDQCPGDGSESSPFRSLSCAFASGSIVPDTAILLRDADTPYEGVDSGDHFPPSGTLSGPISIEPAPGHAPIMGGPIVLAGLDNWDIRDLVFDGSAGAPSGDAIVIEGGGEGITDHVTVEGVTILNWPGRGIVLRGLGSSIGNATIRGNRIEGARDVGIWIEDAHETDVLGNEISQLACVPIAFSVCDACGAGQCAECGDCLDAPMEDCTASTDYDRGHQSGIRVLGDSTATEIADNYIHDFLDDDCGVEGTRTAAVFITGAQAAQGTIQRNLIERIAPSNPDNGYGILMFQSAPEWLVQRNVLTDIGRCALCEGDDLFYGSRDAEWRNNTIIDVEGSGIDIRWAADVEVRANLMLETENGAVRVWEEGIEQVPILDHNLYLPHAETAIGRWGDLIALDLETWQGFCDCDAGAVSEDPLLPLGPPLDLTPGFEGPAIDLEPPHPELPFNGEGIDAGALEAPRVVGARLESGTTIIVELDNQVHSGPEGWLSCAGMTVLVNAMPHPLAECSASRTAIQLHLAEPIYEDPVVTVQYGGGGSITTGANIGGRFGASLPEFLLPVVNTSPLPPEGTDSGNFTSGIGGSGGFVDGFDDGFVEFGNGCSCRSHAPLGSMSLAWLLLLVRRRRPTTA